MVRPIEFEDMVQLHTVPLDFCQDYDNITAYVLAQAKLEYYRRYPYLDLARVELDNLEPVEYTAPLEGETTVKLRARFTVRPEKVGRLVVLRNARVEIGGVDLSERVREVTIDHPSLDRPHVTSSSKAHQIGRDFLAGLQDYSVTVDFTADQWDNLAGAVDRLRDQWGQLQGPWTFYRAIPHVLGWAPFHYQEAAGEILEEFLYQAEDVLVPLRNTSRQLLEAFQRDRPRVPGRPRGPRGPGPPIHANCRSSIEPVGNPVDTLADTLAAAPGSYDAKAWDEWRDFCEQPLGILNSPAAVDSGRDKPMRLSGRALAKIWDIPEKVADTIYRGPDA